MGDDEKNGGLESGSGLGDGGDEDLQIEFVDHETPPEHPARPAPPARPVPKREAVDHEPETGIIEIDMDAELAREAELTANVAELKDQLLRARGDFENYRKRAERDLAENVRRAMAQSLREILPVLDSLERAVAALEKEAPPEWCQGLEAVYRQFQDALGRVGVERMVAEGKPFDPNLHEAMMLVEVPQVPPGTVAEVLEPGYTLQGKLLRPARVKVNRSQEPPMVGGEGA